MTARRATIRGPEKRQLAEDEKPHAEKMRGATMEDVDGNPTVQARMAQRSREEAVRLAEEVVRRMFPGLLDENMPPILGELARNIFKTDGSEPLTARLDGRMAYWGSGGGAGKWNGVFRDFYGSILLSLDVFTIEKQAENIKGEYLAYNPGVTYVAPVGGIAATSGNQPRFWWVNNVPGAPWLAWRVAVSYKLSDGTVKWRLATNASASGDIRLPVPIGPETAKYAVVQQGSGAAGDNGVVAQYVRAH